MVDAAHGLALQHLSVVLKHKASKASEPSALLLQGWVLSLQRERASVTDGAYPLSLSTVLGRGISRRHIEPLMNTTERRLPAARQVLILEAV